MGGQESEQRNRNLSGVPCQNNVKKDVAQRKALPTLRRYLEEATGYVESKTSATCSRRRDAVSNNAYSGQSITYPEIYSHAMHFGPQIVDGQIT
jgi:hypothetical protein